MAVEPGSISQHHARATSSQGGHGFRSMSATTGKACDMLDLEDWQKLLTHYKLVDDTRESLFKRCRDLQKLAKNSIYSLHRNDMSTAAKQLKEAEAIMEELLPIVTANPSLRSGPFSNGLEEYAEAMAFKVYVEEGRVVKWSELPILSAEEYMGGLLDFTGELNRLSISKATLRDTESVQRYYDVVDEMTARFLMMDLKQASLRKKLDPLASTHAKLHHTLYELSLTRGGPLRHVGDDFEEAPSRMRRKGEDEGEE